MNTSKDFQKLLLQKFEENFYTLIYLDRLQLLSTYFIPLMDILQLANILVAHPRILQTVYIKPHVQLNDIASLGNINPILIKTIDTEEKTFIIFSEHGCDVIPLPEYNKDRIEFNMWQMPSRY